VLSIINLAGSITTMEVKSSAEQSQALIDGALVLYGNGYSTDFGYGSPWLQPSPTRPKTP
jgi:hypothetical protein